MKFIEIYFLYLFRSENDKKQNKKSYLYKLLQFLRFTIDTNLYLFRSVLIEIFKTIFNTGKNKNYESYIRIYKIELIY